MKIAGLGNIVQLAYVPRDVNAALHYWTKTMGVGPFFALEHIRMVWQEYLGDPSPFDVTAYIAYWGDIQIELVVQHNDAPSMYKAWLDGGNQGLQHVCVVVDDWHNAKRTITELGGRVVQAGAAEGGAEFLYADFPDDHGPIIEICHMPPSFVEAFASMRRAARDWDGKNPVRAIA